MDPKQYNYCNNENPNVQVSVFYHFKLCFPAWEWRRSVYNRGMKCPKCEQKERQYKNGRTKAGSQRYRCGNCGTSYSPEKKAQGYSQAFRRKAIKMYIDGVGFRRTGRQLGIHHQTVANWVKEEAEQLPDAPVPVKVKAAEFDEIFTYIGDKKTESILLRL